MTNPGVTSNSAATQDDTRKLVLNIPEAFLTALRSTSAAKAEVSLIGRIQGKHPGFKALTAWARNTLHSTLLLLSIKANNLFEVTFTSPEGRIHALTQTELTCETANITFSSWKPHYDSKTPQEADRLDFPIWVQIVDLCQVLRDETFLKMLGEQIGQVIAIDSSEAYRAKLFGPRIRILVKDLNTLPLTVEMPRLDGEGVAEYAIEYSGMPNQCGRCRSIEHQVRHCPRKEFKPKKRNWPPKPTTTDDQEQHHTLNTEPEIAVIQPEESNPTPPIVAAAPEIQPEPEQTIATPSLVAAATEVQPESEQSIDTPSIATAVLEVQPEQTIATDTILEPEQETEPSLDEINFPHLPSPSVKPCSRTPISPSTPVLRTAFVWCPKPTEDLQANTKKGKEKVKTQKNMESTPITRQGYRTGRLAEDFWTAVSMPNTPHGRMKKLRVIPILTKGTEQKTYLVEKKPHSFAPIAITHVAEQLAGLPWTPLRAKQHVVNELSQSLHKVFIFGNNVHNPIQKWTQGQWYVEWTAPTEGENHCTLYVSIMVTEQRGEIRKGRNLEWRTTPAAIREMFCGQQSEDIQELEITSGQWKELIGSTLASTSTPTQSSAEVSPNPFSVLSEEETSS
jgi:hypothetical protein